MGRDYDWKLGEPSKSYNMEGKLGFFKPGAIPGIFLDSFLSLSHIVSMIVIMIKKKMLGDRKQGKDVLHNISLCYKKKPSMQQESNL